MKDILKTHIIKIRGATRQDSISKAQSTLGSLLGVMQVSTNSNSHSLKVSYNLKFVTYAALMRKLRDLGCPPADSMIENLKGRFISFTEKNEIESQARPRANLGSRAGNTVRNHR
jgi:hypothetical protein